MRRLYLAIPAVLLAAALYFAWQGLQGPSAPAAAADEERPRYSVTNAEWVRLGPEGNPEFHAEAEAIDYYADESARLRGVSLDSLGGPASPWHLEAPRAEVPARERRLRLLGDVRVNAAPDAHAPVAFQTRELWVDLLRRELYTEAPVEVQTEQRHASARGLRADFAAERVQLLNDVRVDYVPEN